MTEEDKKYAEWCKWAKTAILEDMNSPEGMLCDESINDATIRFAYDEGDLWGFAVDWKANALDIYCVRSMERKVERTRVFDSALKVLADILTRGD